MISSIASFEIISLVKPDAKIFFWIAASVADAATINPTGIITLLANGLSTLFIKGKPVFSNGPKSLPRNYPDCPILDSSVSDNFLSGDKLFAKAIGNLEVY